MSPRTAFYLTLAGVLLAGAPLLHLTGRSAGADTPAAPPAAVAATQTVWMTLRCTGAPKQVQVDCAGKALVPATECPEGVWEGEVALPQGGRWELEVTVSWPEDPQGGAQAVGVVLSPAGRPDISETQWTFPGESTLHSIFTFPPPQP